MSEVIQRNQEEVEEIAAKKGLVCILPEYAEILVDLDGPFNLVNEKVKQVMQDNGLTILSELKTVSKSGQGSHLYLRLNKDVAPSTRIAIQTCLNSDPIREILSIVRMLSGSDAPTALFETKLQAKRVEAWRRELKAAY